MEEDYYTTEIYVRQLTNDYTFNVDCYESK